MRIIDIANSYQPEAQILYIMIFFIYFYVIFINQSINQSSLASVSSSEDDFGDALSGHSKIHTHHPCDEITDPLRKISVPVPKSNKSVLKEREAMEEKDES